MAAQTSPASHIKRERFTGIISHSNNEQRQYPCVSIDCCLLRQDSTCTEQFDRRRSRM